MHRFALAFVALVVALGCAAQPRFDFDRTSGRLPKTALPTRVALTLDVDPARDTFAGRAQVELALREPMPALVLHAKDLDPREAALVGDGSARALRIERDEVAETWRLVPADGMPIAAGAHRLQLAWRGTVRRAGEALYAAPYRAEGREGRVLATQLQPAFARAVFPAFDEPAFRAVYELTVRAPHGYDVVSNMPQARSQPDGDAVVHAFAPTPPMPSYLVALSVGRFDTLEGDAGGVPLRILAAPGKRGQARYAMDATQRLLPFYADYFGRPYMLPKLDQLAVPSTRWGAMEDWGLVSYEEAALLFDPARDGPRVQRRVFRYVAHELAHQWFGNLVTAASWDEIWLNEAFATWMAHKASERFNAQWHVGLDRRRELAEAMARDAGPATRAIRSGPVNEQRVADVFDDITYEKGQAVLAMLEQWIGPDAFRRGIAAYLAERAYSNATAGDLWHHIGKAAGRDVAAVAASWTDQPGLPVVRVASACEHGRTVVSLAQARFGVRGDGRWHIPVRLARGAHSEVALLDAGERRVELPGCSEEPLVANAGGIGFYRVSYDAAALQRLERAFVKLDPADRVTLLSDVLALAQAGKLPVARWFALVAQIPRVRDASRAVLFTQARDGFRFLDAALAATPAQPRLRAAGRALFAPELARLGWAPQPGDDDATLDLRAMLVETLARLDHAPTVTRARRLFDADAAGRQPLPPSLRAAVTAAVGVHADQRRFDLLLERLRAAGSEEERWVDAAALASGRDAARAQRLLSVSLDGTLPANVATALCGMVGERSPLGELAYRFVLEHFDRLGEIAGVNGRPYLLPGTAQHSNDAAQAARLRADQQRLAGERGIALADTAAAQIELLAAVKHREAAALAGTLAGWRPSR